MGGIKGKERLLGGPTCEVKDFHFYLCKGPFHPNDLHTFWRDKGDNGGKKSLSI